MISPLLAGGVRVGRLCLVGQEPVAAGGRHTNLDNSRTTAYCVGSSCELGLFGYFFLVCHFSFLSPCLWDGQMDG